MEEKIHYFCGNAHLFLLFCNKMFYDLLLSAFIGVNSAYEIQQRDVDIAIYSHSDQEERKKKKRFVC